MKKIIAIIVLILIGGLVGWGIKVSQAGNAVKTAADDKLVMSSDFNMFKIVGKYTNSVVVPAAPRTVTQYTTTVNHNLGYLPAYVAFVQTPAGAGSINLLVPFDVLDYHSADDTFTIDTRATVKATTTNFILTIDAIKTGVAEGTWNFTVYAMKETLN